MSDSFSGKYETIVYLSSVYVVGTALLAGFTNPHTLAYGGVLIGMILMAIGTGGIKRCVSAHGGDQFLEVQKNELNKFYNYFLLGNQCRCFDIKFCCPSYSRTKLFWKPR